jgi:hypothetical protein
MPGKEISMVNVQLKSNLLKVCIMSVFHPAFFYLGALSPHGEYGAALGKYNVNNLHAS